MPDEASYTARWSTPAQALTAAEEFVATLGPHEWLTEVHFGRDWPGGDHDYAPYWHVELRRTSVVALGSRPPYKAHHHGPDLAKVRAAYAEAVDRYSRIDGRDWSSA